MMTIRELCEKHTSLTSADIEKIENMAAVDHFFVHNTDSRNRIAAGQIFDGQPAENQLCRGGTNINAYTCNCFFHSFLEPPAFL